MGIVILLFSGYLFNKRIQYEKVKDRLMIWGAVFLYFAFSVFLNWYLREVFGWAHGIPGSDLQRYFNGAVALKKGTSISNLVLIDSAYELSFTHLGYIAYVVFVAVTAFSPVIFTLEISLQILYCVQALVAITASLNIADFFVNTEDENGFRNTKLRNTVLWAILLCTSVMQMSALLMRDIWILFIISCLLIECKKEKGSIIPSIILIIICTASRYYTLVITIPIFLGYRFNKKKIAAIASLVVFAAFFVGQGYIDYFARIVGIRWAYHYSFDFFSLLSYVMFPNPINQAYNVQHMNTGIHAIFGGNTEWVYYLLSCWNVFVFPISIYGIYRSVRDREGEDAALWGMIIINIGMVMCLFYDAVSSPRHKLLIVISLAYFFKKGIEGLRPLYKVAYLFLVIIGLIMIFAIV
jgi:hypothetical protein